jgi:hypothetical protein
MPFKGADVMDVKKEFVLNHLTKTWYSQSFAVNTVSVQNAGTSGGRGLPMKAGTGLKKNPEGR